MSINNRIVEVMTGECAKYVYAVFISNSKTHAAISGPATHAQQQHQQQQQNQPPSSTKPPK